MYHKLTEKIKYVHCPTYLQSTHEFKRKQNLRTYRRIGSIHCLQVLVCIMVVLIVYLQVLNEGRGSYIEEDCHQRL